ncbi:MAG: glycoside hydrolase [Dehalococcoidia bacterium SG8_51_3]|nr:MAG: glycoside hydrolase [Dehalococcoidia bacterium SG8_51_3]
MERYICVHGHFYQPPRENAWLEYVELQDSAYPFHDWNERITAECYASNGVSRILDSENYITKIVNNYARISFNFGPTLLSWLETHAPDVYQTIIDADKESQQNFSGHGSALAQAYSHMIMPLANRRDKYTQVLWGIRDFERRFGRKPEGMWLPETAVDLETLDIMAEMGLKFTILAPHQAGRVRQLDSEAWADVGGGKIDPTMVYLVNLPSGRTCNLFFYDGPTSRNVAFEGVLTNGENFANLLTAVFSDKRNHPQLIHIATDGETYGHHHRFADMALAYALNYIEEKNLARITNYGEFLEKHPLTHEVEIIENTSWSCAHGVERWRSDCGDNSGGHPKWNQAWRAPLREAMDWLRDTMMPLYENKAKELFRDPWAARDAYIDVILDRSPENVTQFFSQQASHELNETERVTALKLLELQRHAMLMYTSCGWFFDDISGIETVQVIQYAGRVVQLAQELFDDDTEVKFLSILEKAKSNVRGTGDGRRIYEAFVRPAMVDLIKVTAHYAISSLFEDYGKETKTFCYFVDTEDYQTAECGKARLAAGRARVTSEITQEQATLSFGVLHFGDHNLNAGVRQYQGEEAYQTMLQETTQTCHGADFPEVIRLLDKHFGTSTYSLRSLFRDEQRKALGYILESTVSEIEAAYRQLYENHFPAMRFLTDMGGPVPKAFHSAAELVLNIDLHRALKSEALEAETIKNLVNTAESWGVDLDMDGMAYDFKVSLESMMAAFAQAPEDTAKLQGLVDAITLARSMPFSVDLWQTQNQYYEMLNSTRPAYQQRADSGDEAAKGWLAAFHDLGEQLHIRGA